MGAVLEALMSCAVLVQGCWVIASAVLYPDTSQIARRNARDYIVSRRSTHRGGCGIIERFL